jgi:predicted nucleic-acid-binding protein
MRGVDTNILVRYLVEDDLDQLRRVEKAFLEAERQGECLFISVVVLSELIWVLDRFYEYERAIIDHVLTSLLSTSTFEIQHRSEVRRALASWRTGTADFADYLIGELAKSAGCRDTLTFDKALRSSDHFTTPE